MRRRGSEAGLVREGAAGPTALDSSCLVALVSPWHEHHPPTLRLVNELLGARTPLVAPAPALVETYSVLTRMPAPYRSPPRVVHAALSATCARWEIPALSGREYSDLLGELAEAGLGGGRVYDAVIAACARKAGATRLLTWNAAHFVELAGESLRIASP
jgi:predicted nucleic acid-binding protein